jgi:2-iminobutanoate/2-iminopropanoate deaminase
MPASPVPTPHAPAVAAPYSPAVRAGDWVFVSGQIGLDPATGALVDGDTAAQTRRALANLGALLADCGAAWSDVAKVTIFLAPTLADFAAVNECYGTVIGAHRPARSTVAVAALPLGAAVEIEAVVHLPSAR